MGRWYSVPLRRVRASLKRIRHFRGHGVHSPYVYRIVREVLMKRGFRSDATHDIYRALCDLRQIKPRYSREIDNLASYIGCRSFAIDPPVGESQQSLDMVILTLEYPIGKIEEVVAKASSCGMTIVILRPNDGEERAVLCEQIIRSHHCTTIHRVGYLLILNNHLPKQHFQL